MIDEVFKPASDYKLEPSRSISPVIIKEMINTRWNRIYGKLTKEQQIKYKWSKDTVNGMLVRCPHCGKIHEARTLLTKECSICHHSFEIVSKTKGTRIVWIPTGKRRLYDEIYSLTFHNALVVK